VTLEDLVLWAYGVRDFQVVGAPNWFRSARYDIAAKAYRAPDLKHLRLLMQPLLADRFKLLVHPETRQVAVYMLKVGTKGPKMKASQGPASTDAPQLVGRTNFTRSELTGQHSTMAVLAADLSRRLGRPVIDQTALTGAFDFKLEWVPDESQIGRTMPIAEPSANAPDPSGLSLFTALKDQLGLRLESQRGPGEVLVIDHVERIPTEN